MGTMAEKSRQKFLTVSGFRYRAILALLGWCGRWVPTAWWMGPNVKSGTEFGVGDGLGVDSVPP